MKKRTDRKKNAPCDALDKDLAKEINDILKDSDLWNSGVWGPTGDPSDQA